MAEIKVEQEEKEALRFIEVSLRIPAPVHEYLMRRYNLDELRAVRLLKGFYECQLWDSLRAWFDVYQEKELCEMLEVMEGGEWRRVWQDLGER